MKFVLADEPNLLDLEGQIEYIRAKLNNGRELLARIEEMNRRTEEVLQEKLDLLKTLH